MTDLRELLRQGAGPQVTPLDFDWAIERARQFRSRRRGATIAGVVAVIAVAVLALPALEGSIESHVRTVRPADRGRIDDPDSHQSPRTVPSAPAPAKGASGRPVGGNSPSGRSVPHSATPKRSHAADPPVSYADQADDASGPDELMRPSAPLSQKAFDILRVDWAPELDGYSTSIMVAGVATADGAYVSKGSFESGTSQCTLRHYLTPGTTAFAEVSCPSGSSGRVEGGPVTSTPTATGGTVLAATFDNRAIPPMLEGAGRRLHDLSASTCVGKGKRDCFWGDILDNAYSNLTYGI